MTAQLSRFTTNFSVLIQEQRFTRPIQTSTFAGALSQTVARLATHKITSFPTDSLSSPTRLTTPFLQFADALERPSFAISLPTGTSITAAKDESPGWMGLWSNLTMAWPRRLADRFREVRTSLTAIVNALSKPVVVEKVRPMAIGESLSAPPLSPVASRADLSQKIQPALPSLALPKISLLRQKPTAEILNRYQSETRMIHLPLVDVTAKFSQATSLQPTPLLSQEQTRLSEVALPTIFLSQAGAQPPRASPLREMRSHILMKTVTEMPDPSRPISHSVSQRILKLPTGESQASPVAFQILPAPYGSEPVPNVKLIDDAFAPRARYSASPQLPIPAPSVQPSGNTDASSAVTFNGGIHVQITAQSIDRAHPQETARAIAEQIKREVNRISERNRFRRGL